MRAGFQKIDITPNPGTRMSGFSDRDETRPCDSIHDALHARILYLEDDDEEVVIIGFDLLFFSRANAALIKESIGRRLNLTPRQILLNTSHTHTGPCVDTWHTNMFIPADTGYVHTLVHAVCSGVERARGKARAVTLHTGSGSSALPVSRRKPDGRGGIEWLPEFDAEICDHLPLALFQDAEGRPVCLLFSVSCHPSTVHGWAISRDYPGPACDRLDAYLGVTCSLFLQGAAGDTKARVIADGSVEGAEGVCSWRSGNWDDVAAAGRMVADEVTRTLKTAMGQRVPSLSSALMEISFDLEPAPSASDLEASSQSGKPGRRAIYRHMLNQVRMGRPLGTSADLLAQGIRLAENVRIVAVEAEVVGELGNQIISFCGEGTTFALGYSNGTGLYLPSDRMLSEGGYEVASHHEYGFASPLAPGIDSTLNRAVKHLRADGAA